MSLEAVLKEIKGLEDKVTKTLEQSQEEVKKNGKTTEETAKKLEEIDTKHAAASVELKEMIGTLTTRLGEMETKAQRPSIITPGMPEFETIAHKLVESQQFKDWKAHGTSGKSKPVDLHSFVGHPQFKHGQKIRELMELKAISGNADIRGIMSTERLQQILYAPIEAQRVRDLLPTIPTTQAIINFLRETGFDFAATAVAESAGAGNVAGMLPESSFDLADAKVPVGTLAHWLAIPKQLLDDAPSLRAYLDLRLIEGLKLEEDAQILYGDGIGENLTGILTDPDIQKYYWSHGTQADPDNGIVADTKIDAIRKAMTLAQLAHYPVTGLVINPIDWQDVELQKSSHGLYVWVNVSSGATQMIWRLPVVVTTAIRSGTFLLGAFNLGAAVWDREMANIRMSDSHANFFIENRVAILAEERLAVTVYRPQSFVKGTFDGQPGNYP